VPERLANELLTEDVDWLWAVSAPSMNKPLFPRPKSTDAECSELIDRDGIVRWLCPRMPCCGDEPAVLGRPDIACSEALALPETSGEPLVGALPIGGLVSLCSRLPLNMLLRFRMLALPIDEAVEGRACEPRGSESPAATLGAVEGRETSVRPATPLRSTLCERCSEPFVRSPPCSGRDVDRRGSAPPAKPFADPLEVLRSSSRLLLRSATWRASSSLVLPDADLERGSELGGWKESRAAFSPDAKAAMLSSEVLRRGCFGLPFAPAPAVDGRLEGPA
jgi:hypothetical protein